MDSKLMRTDELAPAVLAGLGIPADNITAVRIDLEANKLVKVTVELVLTASSWEKIKEQS